MLFKDGERVVEEKIGGQNRASRNGKRLRSLKTSLLYLQPTPRFEVKARRIRRKVVEWGEK